MLKGDRKLLLVSLALLAVAAAGCVGAGSDAGRGTSDGDGGATPTGDAESPEPRELVLATTTSTANSGLLDAVNRQFESRYDVEVKVLPQGTGASLETARAGDAELVMVHARGLEDEFMDDGFGVNRRDLMYNDFVIVGPGDDPAGISGMDSAAEAFRAIQDSGSTFLSRGDSSGTNTKELAIWDSAIDGAPGGSWYREIGKGMGDTLVQADQSGAYTLADRGTYLSMKEDIGLEILVQGPLKDGPRSLSNPYGVIAVNPAKYPGVNYEDAMLYIGFLTGPEGQGVIEDYHANGAQLFYPDALSEEPNYQQYVPAGALNRTALAK